MTRFNPGRRSISHKHSILATLALSLGALLASPPAAAQVLPPTISKSFSDASITTGGTTNLHFHLENPNPTTSFTGVAFTDNLPAGLVVAPIPNLLNACGGTVIAIPGTGLVSLSGGTLDDFGDACIVNLDVQGTTPGVKNNSVTASSTEGGTGNTSTASITVVAPLPVIISKGFGVTAIALNGTTNLHIHIENPNPTTAFTGVAFTDNLPAGLVVGPIPNLLNFCGGTVIAIPGTGQVTLSGGTLDDFGDACIVDLAVQGTTAGVKINSVTGSSTEGGTGNTSIASLTVLPPSTPTFTKDFGVSAIPLNGSTTLSFTILNTDATVTLTGVGFADTLPAGLVISTPNGLTGSCGGGTITALAGANTVSLTGATLAPLASCTFGVDVAGIAAGGQDNITGNLASTNGGTFGTASASVSVVGPPTIVKAFAPTTITAGALSILTFTISNPAANTTALTDVAFTDILPAGLALANSSTTACGGTLTTTAPSGIALSGATIPINGACQFNIVVLGNQIGSFVNTTSNIASANGGTGGTASASIEVVMRPLIPTLSSWALALLAAMLFLAALRHMRKREC